MENLDWKVKYVLSHRQLAIDKNEIMGYIKAIVKELNELFITNNIEKEIQIDLKIIL